jgi:hypothetical protein
LPADRRPFTIRWNRPSNATAAPVAIHFGVVIAGVQQVSVRHTTPRGRGVTDQRDIRIPGGLNIAHAEAEQGFIRLAAPTWTVPRTGDSGVAEPSPLAAACRHAARTVAWESPIPPAIEVEVRARRRTSRRKGFSDAFAVPAGSTRAHDRDELASSRSRAFSDVGALSPESTSTRPRRS